MADNIHIDQFSPEELNQLSPEELKFLKEQSTPAPGVVQGVARAAGEGALGIQPQPQDKAFARDHDWLSAGGGMLGRAADIALPMLGGRAAGGMLAKSIRPTVNVDEQIARAAIAARRGARTAGIKDRAMVGDIVDLARATSGSAAERANASAQRLKSGMTFGGGLVGGAAGGAGGAYLHGEDPQEGALYGGVAGVAPAVPLSKIAPSLGTVGKVGLGMGAGALGTLAQHSGAPSWVTQGLKDTSLGGYLSAVEGLFKGKKK